nr:phosphoadenosine phosphosulfate reductase family protein [Sphingomonas sp. BT552]
MIDEAVRNGARVVFNLSGGKDCGAISALTMRLLDKMGHSRERRIAIHADLGRAEWRSTPAQVEQQALALGLQLVVVRAASGDLVDRFENRWERGLGQYIDLSLYNLRGPWSSPSLKFCQSEKKIQVMGPHLARTFKGETIINVVGIRREESTGRKNTEVAKLDTRFAEPGNRAGTTMMLWHPGVDLLVDAVFAANVQHGIPLAESYQLGASRHSCAFCIMASANDLAVAANAPGNLWLYRHYVSMEAKTTFSFQHVRWLGDVAPDLLTPGLAADLARAKHLAAERRAVEAQMPARHRYVKGWPLHVPTYDEAQIICDARHTILRQHGATSPYDSPSLIIDRIAGLKATGEAKRARLAA